MIDQRTTSFLLALPHPGNLLSDDVARLREALTSIDDLFNWARSKIDSSDPLGSVPALVEAVKAAQDKLLFLEPAASTALTYTSGVLTQMSELLPSGATRTALYTYDGNGNVATETVSVGGISAVTTYSYSDGVLTGWTRSQS